MSFSESGRPFELGSCEGAVSEELVTIGTPLLRSPAALVDDPTKMGELCDKMVAILKKIQGAGLAAPQIGVSLRVAVMEVRKTELHPDRPETPLYVMINPVIVERSDDEVEGWEGCFSVPGYMGMVARATRLRVRYHTPDGKAHDEQFEGYIARVIQHECDHLDGKVYLDRMRSFENLATKANYLHFSLHSGKLDHDPDPDPDPNPDLNQNRESKPA